MKLKFCQTARLEVCYRLEELIIKVKIFRFWPKTMDYKSITHGLIFGGPKKVLRKACQLNVHEKRNLVALVSVA